MVIAHVCGCDSKGAYSLMSAYGELPHIKDETTLAMAVAGATGISAGSAHTIGALLIPEVGGFQLQDLENLSVVREEAVEGVRCIVIQGIPSGIGKASLF